MSFYFLPGRYSERQMAIIDKFGPRFAASTILLYLRDTPDTSIIYEQERLEQLGVSVTTHNALPDSILYNVARDRLYLIEAGISHRAVTHKRRQELEVLFQKCSAIRIYISVFLNHAEFKRYASLIAWESHVWIAEMPEHMIHYNGDRYIAVHG